MNIVLAVFTLAFAFLASFIAKVGIIISLIHGDNPFPIFTRIIRSIAAGIILGAVFLFLLPLISIHIVSLGIWSLLGLITFAIMDHYFYNSSIENYKPFYKDKGTKERENNVYFLINSIVVKYVLYGIAISVIFCKGYIEGIILALGVVFHQYYESMSNLLSVKRIWPLRRSILLTFFTPFLIPISAGIILMVYFFWSVSFLGPAVSFTVGTLIYIGLCDLIKIPDLDFSAISLVTLSILVIFLLRVFVH